MLTGTRHVVPKFARLLAVALLAAPWIPGCATSAPASSSPAPATSAARGTSGEDRAGHVYEAPADLRPVREAAAAPVMEIDVAAIDLRQVFETIGEDATLWYQHVQTLANPYFEGRVNGSTGTERARDYLEFHMRRIGLEPAFPAVDQASGTLISYRQPFDFRTRGQVTAMVEGARATIGGQPLVDGTDFTILGISSSGEVTGPVSFVGYGIESGPDGYSSFDEGTDLTGRIALLLRYEPLDENGASLWAEQRFSRSASLNRKMRAVQERGAAGIILVNPPQCAEGRTGLEPIGTSSRMGRPLDVPVMQLSMEAAGRLLERADPSAGDLLAWRHLADRGEVTTRDLADTVQVSFAATVERSREQNSIPAENVAGILPGRGALADEWLAVGAHYDHNGYGLFGTSPDDGPLYPGADDNASGTAGMLVTAKRLAEHYAEAPADADLRSVIFIAFDAEERGLHGSRHFMEQPPVAPESMTALINMDMIGRLADDELSVIGVGTGEGMMEILRPAFERSGLNIAVSPAASGRSDDANFHRAGVPGMHFFTGMHPEYTQPTDQAWTVNPIGAARVLDLIEDIALVLATRSQRIVYADAGDSPGDPNRGYAPVRLGIRPGMGEDLDTGILIDGVSPGASAEQGGIEAGDIMLSWNGVELDSLRTMVELMQDHKPGDVVTIVVDRKGTRKELKVTLKASGQ